MKHLSLIHAENLLALAKSRGWTPDVDTDDFFKLSDFESASTHDLAVLLRLIAEARAVPQVLSPSDVLY